MNQPHRNLETALPNDQCEGGDQCEGSAAYRDSLNFLYDRINYERITSGTSRYPFRLNRMRNLLGGLGLSHFLFPPNADEHTAQVLKTALVHIAGTKGKGSTATMVAACLTQSGLKTGLYTSPHLHRLEERFRVDGEICCPNNLIQLVDQVRPVDEQINRETRGRASFFELTTALALLHFHKSGCDAVVMETGLGGRLDSTNVCWPSVTAITSIGLDHQHVLGDTLAKIAAEKAGIIKPGIPVVSGVKVDEASDVIERIAGERNSPLYKIGREFTSAWQPSPDWGSRLEFVGMKPPLSPSVRADLAMEGEHQSRNAAVAIAITQLLRDRRKLSIGDDTIAEALSNVRCAGRIERYALPDKVDGIIDAAHNEDSIAALCDCLRRRAASRPLAIVLGTSVDKSAEPMLELIAKLAGEVDLRCLQVTRFFGNPRWRPPAELMALMPSSLSDKSRLNENPIAACDAALQAITPGGMLVICGSFFLAAETRPWMAGKAGQ